MCTVTFFPRPDGYVLGMNRDELRSRPIGLPPLTHRLRGGSAVYPSEPTGGTWIALNDRGATLALINWYSKPLRATVRTVSRGEVILSSLEAGFPAEVGEILGSLALNQVKPFRLIGVFPRLKSSVEWRWDMEWLQEIQHPWSANQWASSGFDELAAQQCRRTQFVDAIQRPVSLSTRWLRGFHSTHVPQPGPMSICMHREDAATVSYTEVVVARELSRMRYVPGPPCCTSVENVIRLKLRRP